MNKKIIIAEAPVCLGSPTDGSQYAYESLISYGLADILSAQKLPMKGINGVMEVSRRLYETVAEKMREGMFPLTVGGDHSCSIGSIAAASEVCGTEKLSVVYIDGHTDINTEETSPSGFIHGMTLASAMGLCKDEITVGKKVNILGKNTYIVGARSIDEGEKPIIVENEARLYGTDILAARGTESVINEIVSMIDTPFVHVSFDVDFLDGDEFPSTGYRMPGGGCLEDAATVIRALMKTGRVVSFDCVEYNPTLDTDGCDRGKLFALLSILGE